VYVHLSRTHVRVGDRISSGQTIGLSGNTGCSTEPHLHFTVWRHTNTNTGSPVRIDPFGWDGDGADPWAACTNRAPKAFGSGGRGRRPLLCSSRELRRLGVRKCLASPKGVAPFSKKLFHGAVAA
jgi:murein DD-endopeptidase MepM/ murein hydrolase activator NlpD